VCGVCVWCVCVVCVCVCVCGVPKQCGGLTPNWAVVSQTENNYSVLCYFLHVAKSHKKL